MVKPRNVAVLTMVTLALGASCMSSEQTSGASTSSTDTGIEQFEDVGESAPVRPRVVIPPEDMTIARRDANVANVVPFEFTVDGERPEAVYAVINGRPDERLEPPYLYHWDFNGRAEGTYEIQARAIYDGAAYLSPPRTIILDRENGIPNVYPAIVRPESRRSTDGGLDIYVRAIGLDEEAPYELLASGTIVESGSSADGLQLPWDTADLPESTVVLRVRYRVEDTWFWSAGRTIDIVHASNPQWTHLPVLEDQWNSARIAANRNGTIGVSMRRSGTTAVSRWSPGADSWTRLGEYLSSHWNASLPDIAVSPGGTIWAAWNEPDGQQPWEYGNNVLVARWDDESSQWEQVGGILDVHRTDDASRPTMALSDSGQPIVSYTVEESNGDSHARVVEWSGAGAGWQRLGSSLVADGEGSPLSLDVDGRGEPSLAWRSGYANFFSQYRSQFDTWSSTLAPTLEGIATDIAWHDGAPITGIYERNQFGVQRYMGHVWRRLDAGDTPRPRGIANAGSLAVDRDGSLVLAWLRYERFNDLHSHIWRDGQWKQLGAGPIEEDIEVDIDGVDVAMAAGQPVILYLQGTTVHVARFAPDASTTDAR